MQFLKKHIETISLLLLLLVCFFLYFFAMGEYSLIDVDESRYVTIARDMISTNDWLTLRLNGEFFFEKPPLYFWLVNLSFLMFHKISEYTARFPIALLSTVCVFLTYFSVKKMTSRRVGMLTALVMATSLEYLLLSKIAILDIVLSVFTTLSLLCGYLTFFVEGPKRKYFWWGFYTLSALAFLAKGIPGIAIPFGVMFFTHLISGKIRQIFRPIHILPGVILFALISIPWHYIMIKMYSNLFVDKYIIEHHLARFLTSESIGRKRQFWYFIPVFLLAILPWTGSFIAMISVQAKNISKFFKDYFTPFSYELFDLKWNKLDYPQKFIFLNIIAFTLIFLFFSASSTKLPTYILPAVFPAACLLGCFWCDFIYYKQHEKSVLISTNITNGILIAAALTALFTPYFLPVEIENEIARFRTPVLILFFFVPMMSIIASIVKNKLLVFLSNVFFMICLSVICSMYLFNFLATIVGENDLIKFALKAQQEGVKLGNFKFGKKYSLNYYYDNFVDYHPPFDIDWLSEFFDKYPNGYIIVRIKDLKRIDNSGFQYSILESGRRYCIITPPVPEKTEEEEMDEYVKELLSEPIIEDNP